ncbi:diacylglycerol kinase family protein [Elioraea sp. Yellowstone]|uniref:diacylglycerol/lipid kinase family protein n=1 Tax=Elioraea sp. Yellowstone TaxID=2592070 RepID=UPI0013872E54|nr:diacylglycerol kinase family protein [Elioraea sp. Yellowstone]
MRSRMLVIFNPAAGVRRRRRFERVAGALAEAGIRFTVADTTAPGHAEALAREAVAAGERVVVAAGGDGTIAEVVNGIAGSEVRLGVIPIGTANVFAHELGLPFGAAAIAASLKRGTARLVIPGSAHFPDGRTRLFVQMLGVGLDAAVVASLNGALKRRIGKGAYVVETLRQIAAWPFPRLRLMLDGTPGEAAQVIATKGRFYGGRFVLAPEAAPDAAGLSVCVFLRGGWWSAVRAGVALPLGLLPGLDGLMRRRVAALEVAAPSGLPVQADGDLIGATPVTVTDAATRIPVVAA